MLTAERAIDAINQRFGRYPGYRALHAKGIFCRATFRATDEAARLTRAAHMQGEPIEAIVRFSNGSGDPGAPDYSRDLRGMAVTFRLPDGSRTDILGQTAPRFPARDPEGFIEFLRASAPGCTQLLRILLFVIRHPSAAPAVLEIGRATAPPASYASCEYHPIHAFRWKGEGGAVQYVRYTWRPDAGVVHLSAKEARRHGPDYLGEDLSARLADGRGVGFRLDLQLATADDPVDDPTAVWPASRRTVTAGRLEITDLEAVPETAGDHLAFNPMRLTDGIEPASDPVLLFRPPTYELSEQRRDPRPQ